ncbi:major facilitator superfamily domain-containing protein [Kockovaella imperatae]|uniref:Major facilitator superfamily domain-containing protein n=1 Tax=Kockovaella imperatae TaxID=4999 RepID=A0A1Y1U5K3_9TREE|nr:major facilitator superfamily domain-containing protein [Kockovaella imperatae]ORX33310.1 major facilitator superfamily domain-containing protein [Kockovaella imperatae]
MSLARTNTELGDEQKHLDEVVEEGQVGLAEYEQSKLLGEITPEQNKRIQRRIDLFILPLFLITQTLQYLDKTALNYAKVFGMEKAMGMHGNQYSLGAAIFYIGYMFAQPGWSYLLGRFHAGRTLGVAAIIWGILVLVMVWSKTFSHVMVTRFFLGVFEAAVTPGLSLMTAWWYKRGEIPLRQTIWYSAIGWGGMIGSLMAAGITKVRKIHFPRSRPQLSDHPTPRWKLIFYILGSLTVVIGLVLFFFMADGPSTAKWIKKDDRPAAVARVAQSGVGMKTTTFDWKHGMEAMTDPKNWLLSIAMFGSSVPNGVLTNFSGSIIKGLGYSTLNAALLDCAGRSLQVISLLIAGLVATRWANTRLLMMTVGNVICVFGTALMSFLPFTKQYTWARLIGFWLVNCQSIGFTIGLVMISSNIGSYSKRIVTSSCVFIAYCVGNIVGPMTALESEAPRYQTAAYCMMAGYILKTVCHCLLWIYMWRENRKRDREGPADPVQAADNGMRGMTERENRHFRYVL